MPLTDSEGGLGPLKYSNNHISDKKVDKIYNATPSAAPSIYRRHKIKFIIAPLILQILKRFFLLDVNQ